MRLKTQSPTGRGTGRFLEDEEEEREAVKSSCRRSLRSFTFTEQQVLFFLMMLNDSFLNLEPDNMLYKINDSGANDTLHLIKEVRKLFLN